MPMISRHGTSGLAACPGFDTRFAASPTISTRRTSARFSMLHCPSLLSYGRDIQLPRFSLDFGTKVLAQAVRSVEVDCSSQKTAQFILQRKKAHARRLAPPKLYPHIHIALRRKIIAQHAPKQRKPDNAVASAELGDLLDRYVDREISHVPKYASRSATLVAPVSHPPPA